MVGTLMMGVTGDASRGCGRACPFGHKFALAGGVEWAMDQQPPDPPIHNEAAYSERPISVVCR